MRTTLTLIIALSCAHTMSAQVQRDGGETGVYVRLNVVKNTTTQLWANIDVKADSALFPNDTFGSATIDVYYDSTNVALSGLDEGVLGNGYIESIHRLGDSAGTFIRYSVTSAGIGTGLGRTPGHSLKPDWEVLRQIRFTRKTPDGHPRLSIGLPSLSIGFYDSPSNRNGSGVIVESNAVVE